VARKNLAGNDGTYLTSYKEVKYLQIPSDTAKHEIGSCIYIAFNNVQGGPKNGATLHFPKYLENY